MADDLFDQITDLDEGDWKTLRLLLLILLYRIDNPVSEEERIRYEEQTAGE